jgi:hypothetical protein
MKHFHAPITALALAFFLLLPVSSAIELDSFFGEINVTAQADLGDFRADLSATFGVSSGEVDGLFEICDSPADVYFTLRIGEIAEVPIDRVVAQYRAHKGQGWGVIAKNLGIKPGSPEFHALKDGRLATQTPGGSGHKQGKGNGNGANKSKGRN